MLIYKGFIGQIDYDGESDTLVGEVVNAVDLLEFRGQSAIDIRKNFRACIDDYLNMQKQLSGVSPTPFVGNFTICLSTDKQVKVIRAAKRQGQSVSHWLNREVDSHLNKYFEEAF